MENSGSQGVLSAAVIYGALLKCTQGRAGAEAFSSVFNITCLGASILAWTVLRTLMEYPGAPVGELAAVANGAGNS